jgi:hypothetical protein
MAVMRAPCGVVLQQGLEDLHRQVARQQGVQDLLLVRFVVVDPLGTIDRRLVRLGLGNGEWDQLLFGDHLGHGRAELGVEHAADVELAGRKHL